MANDANCGASGDEPDATPAAAPPLPSEFMSSVMERLEQQDAAQKATNEQLAALVAALSAPAGQTSNPLTIRLQLFQTNPATAVDDQTVDTRTLPAADTAQGDKDLNTIQ